MPNRQRSPRQTFDKKVIASIIRDPDSRALVIEALAQIRVGREATIPSAEGLDAGAESKNQERARFWVNMLECIGCLATFVEALRARGLLKVASSTNPLLGEPSDQIDPRWVHIDDINLPGFLDRARAFRCKVRVDGVIKGSGVLVGPSSALTAWHVVAVDGPRTPSETQPTIEVVLSDGRTIGAFMLAPASSPCADVEWYEGRAPKSDAEVIDRHDVALLRLRQPAGIHLSFATLASPPYEYIGPAAIILISHPNGQWQGLEFTSLKRLRNLTARWGYRVHGNKGGSSGGGCFDSSFSLVGIHQGRAPGGGRLVPLVRFHSLVHQAIANDETPEKLWSLDGTPYSGLVVGRDGFFVGYHAAMRGAARVRGLWIRRVNLKHDVSGLPFSYELLDKLVARSPNARVIRVSFDTLVQDLPAEIARRAADASLQVAPPQARSGVGVDQTEPEAMIADRSRNLAQALEDKALALGITLWVFFDHPSVMFGDESRWALTAFVDQALRLKHLRVALAGYEAIQMPGAQFQFQMDAEGEGAPGLMIEYIADVRKEDVQNLIRYACDAMQRSISPERVEEWTEEALEGLHLVNNRYDSVLRTEIASRLQPRLKQLFEK
ncbi:MULTISPECIES: serine protease [Pseudomonas]|uniref:serine protease n=1 Tax=Pseudomonas TaxID=286 RepID=UPI0021F872A5|nr:serine protease [Pseudomonas putida]